VAARKATPVSVVGPARPLVADEGVAGLVVKLDGELAAIERDGDALVCAAARALPAVSAEAARAG